MRRNGAVPLACYPAVDLAADRRPPCDPDHGGRGRYPLHFLVCQLARGRAFGTTAGRSNPPLLRPVDFSLATQPPERLDQLSEVHLAKTPGRGSDEPDQQARRRTAQTRYRSCRRLPPLAPLGTRRRSVQGRRRLRMVSCGGPPSRMIADLASMRQRLDSGQAARCYRRRLAQRSP